MNRRQKTVICVSVVLALLMGLFPPWTETVLRTGGIGYGWSKPIGYKLIFAPPESSEAYGGVKLDTSRLALQFSVLLLCSFGLLLLFRENKA